MSLLDYLLFSTLFNLALVAAIAMVRLAPPRLIVNRLPCRHDDGGCVPWSLVAEWVRLSSVSGPSVAR